MPYAEGTTVSADKTLGEMRALLERHGATRWAHGSMPERDIIQFELNGRHYRFSIEHPLADALRADYIAQFDYPWQGDTRARRIDWKAREAAEWRRRWRARLMWLKAQLEFAEDVPLAESMLSNLVLPDGRTFGQWAEPQVSSMYLTGGMPQLLGEGR